MTTKKSAVNCAHGFGKGAYCALCHRSDKKPAAPQSSPLPSKAFIFPSEPLQVYQKSDDSDPRTLRIIATAATPEDAALIVRRVNQGQAFDAMESAMEELTNACPAIADMNPRLRAAYDTARAALKLAQEVR